MNNKLQHSFPTRLNGEVHNDQLVSWFSWEVFLWFVQLFRSNASSLNWLNRATLKDLLLILSAAGFLVLSVVPL